MCCRIETLKMLTFINHRICTPILIAGCLLAPMRAHAQDHEWGVSYDGDIESLQYAVKKNSLPDGRIWLQLFLVEEVRYEWRAKRDLKALWKREAALICGDLRPAGRPQPFAPVASCDGVTADRRRTGDCGLWAGIAGTLKCKSSGIKP